MLRVHNTLTRKKEVFKPKGKNVKFFVCGITPYADSHIGHAKTYVQFDFIVKYLRYRGFDVFYLQNVTDIDDKILVRAKTTKTEWKKISRKFEKAFMANMKALRVDSIDTYARATDHIPEIVSQVQRLQEKKHAYEIEGDGIYFDLSTVKDYGKLSGRKGTEAEDAVTRIDESVKKRNKGDFCLWKYSKKDEPSWDTAVGKGRPGWHIEDTAITEKFLGQQYDVHGGARDLIFPHHEAEIAQMEAISGKKPFVTYWLHTGFLNVKSEKMSKSLGNFITIKDILKTYTPAEIRYFFLGAHYRSPIDFSEKLIDQSKSALQSINDFVLRCKGKEDEIPGSLLEETKKKFVAAMDDDFDTVKALAVVHDFMREVNKHDGGQKVYNFMVDIDNIFGILSLKEESIPKEVQKLSADMTEKEFESIKEDIVATASVENLEFSQAKEFNCKISF